MDNDCKVSRLMNVFLRVLQQLDRTHELRLLNDILVSHLEKDFHSQVHDNGMMWKEYMTKTTHYLVDLLLTDIEWSAEIT